MRLSDQVTFLRGWVCDRLRIAAIAPSGLALAHLITREISVDNAPVIELGPGTGVFTRRLIQRGIPQQKLVLIESSSAFTDLLSRRFPSAKVLCQDASEMQPTDQSRIGPAGAVVSGLPLVSMSARKIISVLRFAFSLLQQDASFYQFTYKLRCPVPQTILDRCGLTATRIGSTFINMPPAVVYKISRKAALL